MILSALCKRKKRISNVSTKTQYSVSIYIIKSTLKNETLVYWWFVVTFGLNATRDLIFRAEFHSDQWMYIAWGEIQCRVASLRF